MAKILNGPEPHVVSAQDLKKLGGYVYKCICKIGMTSMNANAALYILPCDHMLHVG